VHSDLLPYLPQDASPALEEVILDKNKPVLLRLSDRSTRILPYGVNLVEALTLLEVSESAVAAPHGCCLSALSSLVVQLLFSPRACPGWLLATSVQAFMLRMLTTIAALDACSSCSSPAALCSRSCCPRTCPQTAQKDWQMQGRIASVEDDGEGDVSPLASQQYLPDISYASQSAACRHAKDFSGLFEQVSRGTRVGPVPAGCLGQCGAPVGVGEAVTMLVVAGN
jgi:hypothetical protein